MTAKEEIELWKNKFLKISDKNEEEALFKAMEESILSKGKVAQQEHLKAFKNSVFDLGKRVEDATNEPEIKVYPSSCEERELLKTLLSKMNIRFELG